MSKSEILRLVENGLRTARGIAEHAVVHADDGFLLYLIEMAILEVKRKGCSREADGDGPPRLRQYLVQNRAA